MSAVIEIRHATCPQRYAARCTGATLVDAVCEGLRVLGHDPTQQKLKEVERVGPAEFRIDWGGTSVWISVYKWR